jgi:hypothetical protein
MKKSTLYLIATFIILLVFAYLVFSPTQERTSSYSLSDLDLKIDSAIVNKIEIVKGNTSVTLEHTGGKWNLSSPVQYLADEPSVLALLSSANKFKIMSLVSSNPTKQTLYQVDATTGTNVKFSDRKGKTVSLIVGKMGPSYSETYIRTPGSNDVYLAEGFNSWSINKEVREWRDKTILKTEKDAIKQLAFEYAKDKFSLVKLDSINWSVNGDSANNSTVSNLLSSLANLRTEDFIDTTVSLPPAQLKLQVMSNETINLQFQPMPPDSAKYWVSTSQSPQIFVVNKYTAQQILKQKKDWKK